MSESSKRVLSGTDKILIGCGIGCGLLLLAAMLAVGGGAFWVLQPGEQHDTAAAVDNDALGVVHIDDLASDSGIQALMTAWVEVMQDAQSQRQREQLPESMHWLADRQNQQSAASFTMFMPKSVTVGIEPHPGDETSAVYVASGNFRSFVRPIRAILNRSVGQEGEDAAWHREQQVLHLDTTTWASFVGGTLLLSNHPDALRRAIDRTLDGTSGGSPRWATIPEGEWDLEGSLVDDQALLMVSSLMAALEQPIDEVEEIADSTTEQSPGDYPPDGDLELAFGLDVATADQAIGRMILTTRDAEAAQAWLAYIELRLPALQQRAADNGLDLELEIEQQEDRLVAALDVSGLANSARTFAHWLDHVENESENEGGRGGESEAPVEPLGNQDLPAEADTN